MNVVIRSNRRSTIRKMLTLIFTIFVLSIFLGGFFALADSDDQHGRELEVVLQEIREQQRLGPEDAINPRKVSDEDLEEVGEAVMSIMHPDPQQHQIMDDMMGGEGSRRLARIHRRMGYNYLAGRGYGMMGGMMGRTMGRGMM